jgi:hypothetical protein
VPTLHIVQAATAERAREIAAQMIADSLHHLGAEVVNEGEVIFTLGYVGNRPPPSRPPGGGRPQA